MNDLDTNTIINILSFCSCESWNNILNVSKQFNAFGRAIFDHSVNSNKYIIETLKHYKRESNFHSIKYLVENNKIIISDETFEFYSLFGQEDEAEYRCKVSSGDQMLIYNRLNALFDHVCYIGDYEMTKILVKHERICSNNNIWNVLNSAINRNHWNIVELLIESKRFEVTDYDLRDGGEKLREIIEK